MSAAAVLLGAIALTYVMLVAILLRYETLVEFLIDFFLTGVLVGLSAFVLSTAVQMVKSNRPSD